MIRVLSEKCRVIGLYREPYIRISRNIHICISLNRHLYLSLIRHLCISLNQHVSIISVTSASTSSIITSSSSSSWSMDEPTLSLQPLHGLQMIVLIIFVPPPELSTTSLSFNVGMVLPSLPLLLIKHTKKTDKKFKKTIGLPKF